MGIFDKKEEFNSFIAIDKSDLKDARLSAVDLAGEKVQKRAFMNVLGARLAMKMMFSQHIEANNLYSLYTIQNVLQEFDLADIYFQGIKIDVRLVFDRNHIFVPKKQFELNMLADIYLVIELKSDLSGAEFIGFFEPSSLNKSNCNGEFYFYDPSNLINPEEIKRFLDEFIVERNFSVSEEDSIKAQELFLSFVDHEISQDDKLFLLKQLSSDIDLREKMVELENFELISKNVVSSGLLQDQTLEVIGAQLSEEASQDDIVVIDTNIDSDEGSEDFDDIFEAQDEVSPPETGNSADSSGSSGGSEGSVVASSVAGAVAGGMVAAGASVSATSAISALAGASAGSILPDVSIDAKIEVGKPSTDNEDIIDSAFEQELLPELDLGELEPLESLESDEIEQESEIENSLQDEIQEESHSQDVAVEEQLFDSVEDVMPMEIDELAELDQILENNTDFDSDILAEVNQELELFELDDAQGDNSDGLIENDSTEAEHSADDVVGLEELPTSTGSCEIDETSEVESDDVISLEDFDFDLLKEDSDVQDEAFESSEAVSFEELTGQESQDEIAQNFESDESNDVQSSSYAQDVDSLLEEQNVQSAYDIGSEPIIDDTDDFISQVDSFLNEGTLAGITLEGAQNTLFDDEILNSGDIDQYSNPSDEDNKNQTIQALFQDGSSDLVSGDYSEFAADESFISETGEIPSFTQGTKPKINKKVLIAASVAGVILVSVIASNVMKKNSSQPENLNAQNPSAISAQGQAPESLDADDLSSDEAAEGIQADFQNEQLPDSAPAGKAKTAPPVQNRDMGKAVSDIFLSEPVNTTISKVGWEVPEDLAYNDNFRKYLQNVGRNIKLNLQNNLLLATEMAYSNKVVVDLNINKSGALTSSDIVTSSGSAQIDGIVLQSVNDALKYLKVPAGEVNGNSFNATLIINF